ncbi:Predicted membrane protein [Mycobacteroides abscessus subsp. abscessus]|nr:YoaK family protein [Mycobacteroides abscessus]SIK40096.1 Predicted membrane protein [Mycobacteroides abscessus subsp. abscessus]
MAQAPRWPVAVAAALTFGAGALDVLALTRLGGVFASVMTGNLALLGIGLAHLDIATAVHTGTAIAGYACGVAVGARIVAQPAHRSPVWPKAVTATLTIEGLLLLVFAAGWAVDTAPTAAVRTALLVLAATSMGLQSAAVRGLGVPLATTYLTGTVTALIAERTSRSDRPTDAAGIAAVVAAVAGAAAAGVTVTTAPQAAPLLCVCPLAAVLAVVAYRQRSPHGS